MGKVLYACRPFGAPNFYCNEPNTCLVRPRFERRLTIVTFDKPAGFHKTDLRCGGGCGAEPVSPSASLTDAHHPQNTGPVPPQGSNTENRHRRRLLVVAPFALALLLASASLWMFTRNNDFPLDYHPDEPGKVAQLMHPAQIRNFTHPLLRLEAANVVRIGLGVHNDERAIAIAGRWTSAALAAILVFALAIAGYFCAGYQGLLMCGAMAALCPALDVYAHFFKEDTALLAGLAVALAGAGRLVGTNHRSAQCAAAVIMGTGCAAAISGKYVGLAAVGPCLAAIILAPSIEPRSPLLRFLAFAIPAATSILAVNFRAFENFFLPRLEPAALERIAGEFSNSTTGHEDLALAVPNIFSLQVGISELMPHVWLFIAIGIVSSAPRGLLDRSTAVAAAFLLTFAVVLSYSAFPFPRYALPITVLSYFVAGQLMATVLRRMKEPWLSWAVFVTCLGLIGVTQGAQCWRLNMQFADDSRQRLREWVALHLGEQTAILAEDFTSLGGAGDPWRYPDQSRIQARIVKTGSVADRAQTIDHLKTAGVDYVVVAEPKYERYFRPSIHSVSYARQEDLLRRQWFYRELFARAELVWSSVPSPPSHAYVNPELRVYGVPNSTANASQAASPRAGELASSLGDGCRGRAVAC
jgi:hypothetical protein